MGGILGSLVLMGVGAALVVASRFEGATTLFLAPAVGILFGIFCGLIGGAVGGLVGTISRAI